MFFCKVGYFKYMATVSNCQIKSQLAIWLSTVTSFFRPGGCQLVNIHDSDVQLKCMQDHSLIYFGLFMKSTDTEKKKKHYQLHGCYQTCYIIKFSEVQFNVIPLHDYAAVGVWGGHRYKDVVFEGEDVRWYGLNGDGLMTHKVCEMRTKTETAGLLIKWKHQNLHTHSFSYISVLWEASFMYSGLLNLAFSLVIFYFWDCMFFNSHLQWP